MATADEHRAEAANRPNDLIAAVLEDHADIQSLLGQVDTSTGDERRDAFEQLVAKLAVHETAEEQVVHPLTKRTAGADGMVEQRLEEEDEGKKALAELERLGTKSSEFQSKFDQLRSEVLQHAENEEQQEFPLLAAAGEDRLVRAASVFRAAQAIAPTRAHEHAPTSAIGNTVIGPFVAMADRTRDAIRNATRGDMI